MYKNGQTSTIEHNLRINGIDSYENEFTIDAVIKDKAVYETQDDGDGGFVSIGEPLQIEFDMFIKNDLHINEKVLKEVIYMEIENQFFDGVNEIKVFATDTKIEFAKNSLILQKNILKREEDLEIISEHFKDTLSKINNAGTTLKYDIDKIKTILSTSPNISEFLKVMQKEIFTEAELKSFFASYSPIKREQDIKYFLNSRNSDDEYIDFLKKEAQKLHKKINNERKHTPISQPIYPTNI